MAKIPFCDICGLSENALHARVQSSTTQLERDSDNLWICDDCKSNLITQPVGHSFENELDEELMGLIGKSAGAICHTLNLPFRPPYQSVIEAASNLGIPVSTTQCISGSVMGVGATRRLSAVRWGVAGNIVTAWILTIPVCAILGWILGKILGNIG